MNTNLKEDSYYFRSYHDKEELIKEYLHTGSSYKNQFGDTFFIVEELIVITCDRDTGEVKEVSWEDEIWEPSYYIEFKELNTDEYQLGVEYCEQLLHELQLLKKEQSKQNSHETSTI